MKYDNLQSVFYVIDDMLLFTFKIQLNIFSGLVLNLKSLLFLQENSLDKSFLSNENSSQNQYDQLIKTITLKRDIISFGINNPIFL